MENSVEKSNCAIAIFAYSRPHNLSRILRDLELQGFTQKINIYIFCDGPVNGGVSPLVGETREVARSRASDRVTVVERKANFGLSRNITEGLLEVSQTHSSFIAIEDDVSIEERTLRKMIDLLDSDWTPGRLGAASSASFDCVHSSNEWVSSNRFMSWGWGARSHVWQNFCQWRAGNEITPATLISMIPRDWSYLEKLFVKRIYRNFHSLDSWAIPFSHFLRTNNYLVVSPGQNGLQMLTSIGSTHTDWAPLLPKTIKDPNPTKFFLELSSKELVNVSRRRIGATIKGYVYFQLKTMKGKVQRV